MNRYVKVGLFTVLVVALVTGGAMWLGMRGSRSVPAFYHTYFDVSVQGLDVGSLVKFRGVEVGHVDSITIAADSRHVDVRLRFEATRARSLGLDRPNSPVRARAVTLGVTGVKIIDLDVVDPAAFPPQKLPFEQDAHTIAAAPSLSDQVQKGAGEAAEQIPALLESLSDAVAKLSAVVDQVRDHDVVGKVDTALVQVGAAAAELKTLARALDSANVAPAMGETLTGLNQALARLNVVLERLSAEDGLVSSAQRATEAFGELGRASTASTTHLETTLRDVDEAARAIRDLALEVQRQPDVLVKGRARPRK